MIVRISTEGQYELDSEDAIAEVNRLDNEAVDACKADDEQRFRSTYQQLLELVRTRGRPLNEDELQGSDVILPPPDVSMDEARSEFSGEGLIPG